MRVSERVLLCRLIEKIDKHKNYADKIGIVNKSMFKGKRCSLKNNTQIDTMENREFRSELS